MLKDDREILLCKLKKINSSNQKIAILIDCGGSLSNAKIVINHTTEEEAKELLLLKEHKNLTTSVRFINSIDEYDQMITKIEAHKG